MVKSDNDVKVVKKSCFDGACSDDIDDMIPDDIGCLDSSEEDDGKDVTPKNKVSLPAPTTLSNNEDKDASTKL